MRTDDPDVCLERNPHAHNRMLEKDGVCSICGGRKARSLTRETDR